MRIISAHTQFIYKTYKKNRCFFLGRRPLGRAWARVWTFGYAPNSSISLAFLASRVRWKDLCCSIALFLDNPSPPNPLLHPGTLQNQNNCTSVNRSIKQERFSHYTFYLQIQTAWFDVMSGPSSCINYVMIRIFFKHLHKRKFKLGRYFRSHHEHRM